jgi:hypothetical protein
MEMHVIAKSSNLHVNSCFSIWITRYYFRRNLPLANARDKYFTKIMLPILKLDTNYGFHELFLNKNVFPFIEGVNLKNNINNVGTYFFKQEISNGNACHSKIQ